MDNMQVLFQTVKKLSREELKQLRQYIDQQEQVLEAEPTGIQPRILGLHAHLGRAWLSDDFFAELSDEFWLGEE